MDRLQAQLPALQQALIQPPGPSPSPSAVADAAPFIRGIERKSKFVQLHSALLAGVRWDRLESIGRRMPGGVGANHLTIPLADAHLVIEHSEAVIDHVYMAFDGLTAALVNMTDTMGRLLRARYQLQIPERKASLLSLKDPNQCVPTSPIGVVVNDTRYTEWLVKVRDLRGRCQHADIDHALLGAEGPYSRRGEPFIRQDYYWQTPSRHVPLITYGQEAALAAEDTLLAVIAGVLRAPQNPCV